MRPHRRRHPVKHVLVAGELEDLDAIECLLQLLPADAYGQVFVETDADLPVLTAPARVTVARLARVRGADSDGDQTQRLVLAARGALLTDAVTGWLAEWMPEDPADDREVELWIGARANDRVNTLCDRLDARPQRL